MDTANADVVRLLTEIRDHQREQIALSKKAVDHAETQAKLAMDAAERSIANQQKAIATQQSVVGLYRRMMFFVMPVLLGALAWLIWKILPHL